MAQLQNDLRPLLLRRVKEDVEKSIPPKEETIVYVEMTNLQKTFYRAVYEKVSIVQDARCDRACQTLTPRVARAEPALSWSRCGCANVKPAQH